MTMSHITHITITPNPETDLDKMEVRIYRNHYGLVTVSTGPVESSYDAELTCEEARAIAIALLQAAEG